MLFVVLAIFEYAVMLAIRFGKKKRDKANQEEICNKIDRKSLWLAMGLYVLAVGSYFYTVTTHS